MNKNPNWKAEQRELAKRANMVHIHNKDAKLLQFSDRIYARTPSGSLIRVAILKRPPEEVPHSTT